MPHPASAEEAGRILEGLRTMSAVYGTRISIQKSVGIIHASAALWKIEAVSWVLERFQLCRSLSPGTFLRCNSSCFSRKNRVF